MAAREEAMSQLDSTARVLARRSERRKFQAGSRSPFLLARVIEHIEDVNGSVWTKPNRR